MTSILDEVACLLKTQVCSSGVGSASILLLHNQVSAMAITA